METLKMKFYNRKSIGRLLLPSIIFIFCLNSCESGFLEEKPLSLLSDEYVLSSKAGFEAYIVGLNARAANELPALTWNMTRPTDMFNLAGLHVFYRNWVTYQTPALADIRSWWNWAYSQVIPQANIIIQNANRDDLQDIWANEAEKNAIIAEARFHRGYMYNALANLFGGVPIVDEVLTTPKYDYVRATREEVYEFVRADLEFASQWLPTTVPANQEGRIVKAAADHLLSEVCISLGDYDDAIASATNVINSGLYNLMTTRFGVKANLPGDPFSDLFQAGNYNRSSGNREAIWVWQVEEFTLGSSTNRLLFHFAPFLVNIKDPAGFAMLITDSLGRGVGGARPSNYATYEIWQDNWNDMRNSRFNMRREFYYNNPKSPYYLQKVGNRTTAEDTLRNMYHYSRKVEGPPFEGINTGGRTAQDWYSMRLAETYLLRAEAYFRKNDLVNAASDINVVRARANVTPVSPADVTLDYILDERARELMCEEPRTRTLTRTGTLVERIRKYDIVPQSRSTIQDYHAFWPIPQVAIDANLDAVLEQNPGYN